MPQLRSPALTADTRGVGAPSPELEPAGSRLGVLFAVCLALLLLLLGSLPAQAAEVLQVRSATLLQVGDGNRSYGVRLACLDVAPEQQDQALEWLRDRLPRQTRVNLRPLGVEAGTLVARVTPLPRQVRSSAVSPAVNGIDLSAGLIDAQLASPGRGDAC